MQEICWLLIISYNFTIVRNTETAINSAIADIETYMHWLSLLLQAIASTIAQSSTVHAHAHTMLQSVFTNGLHVVCGASSNCWCRHLCKGRLNPRCGVSHSPSSSSESQSSGFCLSPWFLWWRCRQQCQDDVLESCSFLVCNKVQHGKQQ